MRLLSTCPVVLSPDNAGEGDRPALQISRLRLRAKSWRGQEGSPGSQDLSSAATLPLDVNIVTQFLENTFGQNELEAQVWRDSWNWRRSRFRFQKLFDLNQRSTRSNVLLRTALRSLWPCWWLKALKEFLPGTVLIIFNKTRFHFQGELRIDWENVRPGTDLETISSVLFLSHSFLWLCSIYGKRSQFTTLRCLY